MVVRTVYVVYWEPNLGDDTMFIYGFVSAATDELQTTQTAAVSMDVYGEARSSGRRRGRSAATALCVCSCRRYQRHLPTSQYSGEEWKLRYSATASR